MRKELDRYIKLNGDLRESIKAIEEEALKLENQDIAPDPAVDPSNILYS